MLKQLVEHFSEIDSLPIEVPDVTGALTGMGCQDSFIVAGEPTDPGKVRGVYYQYTTSPGLYCAPELTTLVVYSTNLSPEWQRLVCVKELVHVCDSAIQKTNTDVEVEQLLEKLLGPLSTEDYGLADLMASTDKLAAYQAACVLFPLAAREKARAAIASGERTKADIDSWTCIPPNMVALVLSDDWPDIVEALIDC